MAKLPQVTYDQLIERHLEILKSLQVESGLFLASKQNVETGYDKSWLRDNFYETMGFEVIGDWETVEKTYNALLEVFLRYEEKIDAAINEKPKYTHQYIHARFHPETFDEFWEEWGNRQNDAIGAILFRIGELEHHHKRSVLHNDDRIRIVNKLVQYLRSIEYWHDEDSGMWEEDQEIHASSIGACIAGLKSVDRLPQIDVPGELIRAGEVALNELLPRESARKFADLAELSLIYPYKGGFCSKQRDEILNNIEYHLLRERGVIRYKSDYYYNNNPDGFSEEAEWTFGLAWLAIIYEQMGNKEKAKHFLDMMIDIDTKEGVPELYFSNSPEYNENTPLGWSESLFIVALEGMKNKKRPHAAIKV